MIRQNPPSPPVTPTPGPNAVEWRWNGQKEPETLPHWFCHADIGQPDPTVAWSYRITYFDQFNRRKPLTYATEGPPSIIFKQETPEPPKYTWGFLQIEAYSETHKRACGARTQYAQNWNHDETLKVSFSGVVIDPARWQPKNRFGPMIQGAAWFMPWSILKANDDPWQDFEKRYPAWAVQPISDAKAKAIAWYDDHRARREADPGSLVLFGDRNAEYAIHQKCEREWPLPQQWPGKDRLVPWRVWVRWRKDYSTLTTDEGMTPWYVSVESLDPEPEFALWEFKEMQPVVRHVIMERVTP